MNRKELLEAIEQKKCELNKLNELLSKSREEGYDDLLRAQKYKTKVLADNTLNDFKIENNKDLNEDDDLIQEFIKFAKSNNLSIYEFRL